MTGESSTTTDLRYPIGPFKYDGPTNDALRQRFIGEIAAAPSRVRAAVAGLSDEQLDTPYRPGGWTVRQVVHHLADSHINAYVRLRWLLTEKDPAIKAYNESVWAELADARTAPVELSLRLLEALHERWVALMKTLSSADFARPFQHPEYGHMTGDVIPPMYAWHGRHHVAHITSLRERMGW